MNVLIAFPFSIYPLRSGGALRGYNLLLELARHHEVDAFVVDASSNLYESIKSDLGHETNTLRITTIGRENKRRGLWRVVADRLTTAVLSRSVKLRSNTNVLSIASAIADAADLRRLDVAIFSTQQLAICGSLIKKISPRALRIVDLHNVDHLLLKQAIESGGLGKLKPKRFHDTKSMEGSLFRYSDGVFACSESDLKTILELNRQKLGFGAVVPNGVRCSAVRFDQSSAKSKSTQILFCGSLAYGPNIDGLNWVHSMVWPLVKSRRPDFRLIVVGKGLELGRFLKLAADDSVDLVGEVEDLQPWYHSSGVSICPLRMGSGTRLKILEAMAYGNPVISTSMGCEGLSVADGENILIRDTAEAFAEGILALTANQAEFDRIRFSARSHVERTYDWNLIGSEVSRTLAGWRKSRI